jgi:hypothetical protein
MDKERGGQAGFLSRRTADEKAECDVLTKCGIGDGHINDSSLTQTIEATTRQKEEMNYG